MHPIIPSKAGSHLEPLYLMSNVSPKYPAKANIAKASNPNSASGRNTKLPGACNLVAGNEGTGGVVAAGKEEAEKRVRGTGQPRKSRGYGEPEVRILFSELKKSLRETYQNARGKKRQERT